MGITPFPNWDSGSTESTRREKISQIMEASRRPTELTVRLCLKFDSSDKSIGKCHPGPCEKIPEAASLIV